MNIRSAVVVAAAVPLALVGCNHQAGTAASTASPSATRAVAATTSASPPATTATAQSVRECPVQDAAQIKILSGDVSCADAHSIAAQYDLQGDKYQQIDTWTCYSEITATSPLMLTCASDQNAEFAVYSTL